MNLDLRWPLGLIFGLFGLLLCGFGALSDPSLYDRSLGINIDLIWGAVVLAFGIAMLILAGLARRKKRR